MLQKTLSKRETALLLVLALLIIGIVYYWFVWKTSEEQFDAAQERQAVAEDALTVEQTQYVMLETMRAELAALDQQTDSAAQIPPYDNAKPVMQLLNTVLSASGDYTISFDNVAFQDALAIRTMKMSFSCRSYLDAKTIIRALYSGPYRCRIGAMSFSAQGTQASPADMNRTPVSVNMGITFYEYMPPAAAEGAQ